MFIIFFLKNQYNIAEHIKTFGIELPRNCIFYTFKWFLKDCFSTLIGGQMALLFFDGKVV